MNHAELVSDSNAFLHRLIPLVLQQNTERKKRTGVSGSPVFTICLVPEPSGACPKARRKKKNDKQYISHSVIVIV